MAYILHEDNGYFLLSSNFKSALTTYVFFFGKFLGLRCLMFYDVFCIFLYLQNREDANHLVVLVCNYHE